MQRLCVEQGYGKTSRFQVRSPRSGCLNKLKRGHNTAPDSYKQPALLMQRPVNVKDMQHDICAVLQVGPESATVLCSYLNNQTSIISMDDGNPHAHMTSMLVSFLFYFFLKKMLENHRRGKQCV